MQIKLELKYVMVWWKTTTKMFMGILCSLKFNMFYILIHWYHSSNEMLAWFICSQFDFVRLVFMCFFAFVYLFLFYLCTFFIDQHYSFVVVCFVQVVYLCLLHVGVSLMFACYFVSLVYFCFTCVLL